LDSGSSNRQFSGAQAEADVPEDGHVGVEGIVLEHHSHVAVAWPHVVDDLFPDRDGTLGNVLEARDRAQKGALAAAGRPYQNRKFSVPDGEIDAAKRLIGPVALLKSPDGHLGHGVFWCWLCFIP
jgi:hypothetical protein